ncbi:MAG: hypothetical protein U5K53_02090 [Halanaerobiales bacterium]|nr:hypothetical protein [Halanaerobiales bacterium]
MIPYVSDKDLYRFKLALILGNGNRLKKLLRRFPTEKRFKKAKSPEIAHTIGISDYDSDIINKLDNIDDVFNEMVTFKPDKRWSKKPDASIIMGIDTEYLKSELDCIQYTIMEDLKIVDSGFIFTNNRLAPSITIKKGIDFLRNVINEYNPELIVGHNFNSDISILENAYMRDIPELYYYDDTMNLMQWSNLSNIMGSAGLNKVVTNLFDLDVVDLFTAYDNLSLLIEYGMKDTIYPILIRHFVLNSEMPDLDYNFKINKVIKDENRNLLKSDMIRL